MKRYSDYVQVIIFLVLSLNLLIYSKFEHSANKNNSEINMQHTFGVVLAGGSGTRLWPISRNALPKQCINFRGDKTLLQITIDRITPLAPQKNICIVTSQQYKTVIDKLINGSAITNIVEPEARNTAAAILLSVLEIYDKNPEALLFFVPADHYISENELFVAALQEAISLADRERKIVLVGIKPRYASTEYGYIETPARPPAFAKAPAGLCFDQQAGLSRAISREQAQCERAGKTDLDVAQNFEIKNFYEKPDKARAQEFIAGGNFLWNAGIFVGKAAVFLEEFRVLAPELLEKVKKFRQGAGAYSEAPALSFDKLILERTKNRAVVQGYFSWSDVGSLENFICAQEKSSKIIEINAQNNLVSQAKKIVVLSGVDNLCVIETDDLILVCPREQSGNIKTVTEYLKKNGHEKYL